MKTTVAKDIYHSLIVSENDLNSIFDFLKSKYNSVQLMGDCNDGSSLETGDVDEILRFENVSYRKFTSIRIKATSGIDDVFSLGIYSDRYKTSEIYLYSKNDERALFISQEIQKRLTEMKPAYDWIARISILFATITILSIVGLVLSGAEILGMREAVHGAEITIYDFFNRTVLLGLLILIATYPIDMLRKYLFPKVFILIGKQKTLMETIKKWRSFIFITLLASTFLGIGVNWLSNYFFD